MKKPACNPFLPLNVCIPDGEPHVFGDRVYLFGSHEKLGDNRFCSLGYEFFSAPVDDLSDWSSKGINYEASQDPDFGEDYQYMYAPDVVQGNDGRFYLYYAMSGKPFTGSIHVAVCDTPDGKYEFYGRLQNPDGSEYTRKITFDPAVINDNGTIRLYYGWALAVDPDHLPTELGEDFFANLLPVQQMLFGKSAEEIESEPGGLMGVFTVELAEDMRTVLTEPVKIVPGQFEARGTQWENHAFFEGSSIRKIGETYYFIYSTENQHELCYATSQYPDRDFRYGGTIVSNGDIGLDGRKPEDRVNATANNHGSIAEIDGQWYVFYHRHTHKTTFSRQACAERIEIRPDGGISQVEITSSGLNDGPLPAVGAYPAAICCQLTNGKMPHMDVRNPNEGIPYITHAGDEVYITEISDGTAIGYKYFAFHGKTRLCLTVRGGGCMEIAVGTQKIRTKFGPSLHWQTVEVPVDATGTWPVYITCRGGDHIDLLQIEFQGE